MKTLLLRLFYENWQRKLVSLFLACVIWFMVGQSLTTSRTLTNIPVRVINIPTGKTIIDLQSNGLLSKRISLTLIGSKETLDELSPGDLEIVLDAQNKEGEWIVSIAKRNLICLNPDMDILKGISRVSAGNITIRLTNLVSEKIRVLVTQPIGEAPRDYQYLDVWPHELTQNISGPEEVVKRLKAKGARLTFNLNDISKSDLDALKSSSHAAVSGRGTIRSSTDREEVSFLVPNQWKRLNIPLLSDTPIEIDDPLAEKLRIDFACQSLLPVACKIPVSLYFTNKYLEELNPQTVSLESTPLIESIQGLSLFSKPLFAKGVSHLFVKIVEEMLELSILVEPSSDGGSLHWGVEFINPRLLEDRYVALSMGDVSDEKMYDLPPLAREEYLRTRFRSYMNRFQLFTSDDKRLELHLRLDKTSALPSYVVKIEEGGSSSLPHSKNWRKE